MTIKDFFDINFRNVIWKSTHRDTFGKPYVAACESKVEFFRDCSRVLTHDLVKITHAQQYHGLRICFLRFQILTINRTYKHLVVLFGQLLCLFGKWFIYLFDLSAANNRFVCDRFFLCIVYDFDFL